MKLLFLSLSLLFLEEFITRKLPQRVFTSVSDMQVQLRSRECDLFLLEKEVEELRAEMKYDFPT